MMTYYIFSLNQTLVLVALKIKIFVRCIIPRTVYKKVFSKVNAKAENFHV